MALASASISRPASTPPTPASSHSPSPTFLPSSSSPSPAPTSSPSTSSTQPAPVLPKAHPLAAELLSLRQQLSQYRQAAHQASIDVQGVRLELDLAKEEAGGLRATNAALTAEVDTLRNTPNPPAAASPSNALAELSLAHRRLSAKLDFTEQQLGSVSLELASTKQELQRTQREREGERAVLIELRRIEEDREEECQFERSERQRIEEQKKLVDLALNEYAALVARLDPAAVPPAVPRRAVDNVLQQPPALTAEVGEKDAGGSDEAPAVPPKQGESTEQSEQPKDELAATTPFIVASTSTDSVDALASSPLATADKDLPTTPSLESRDPLAISTSADAISNLLIGQRGVHRLFKDFSTALHAKDQQVHGLQTKCDDLEGTVRTLREQLDAETTVRVEAQSDRDRVLRDDASAAKVVERYMTFSQKAHQIVHMHLGQQRQRASATQASLRAEGAAYRHRMRSEADRSARLRAACEEMADELGRESAGRRREVALRLGMIAADEARAHHAEGWLDRVRRARENADGAASAPNWTALVDEAVEILAPADKDKGAEKPSSSSSGGGFRARFLRRKTATAAQPAASASAAASTAHEDQSLARIFLAEELVQNLVADLQVETERRIELELQRVAWLAKEAEDGVPAASGEAGGVMFDMDDEEKESEEKGEEQSGDKDASKEDGEKSNADEPETGTTTSAPEPPNSPPVPPEMDELTTLFEQLEARYQPLQKSLHDQAHSLKALRTSLPPPPESTGKRASVGRALALRPARTAHDDLVAILDGLHEVIEDARVDAEIAVADEDRQFHGFAALLGVGTSGVVQASSVLRDARAYADVRSGPETPYARLSARVGDIEGDLALVKTTLHEAQGMHEVEEDAGASIGKGKKRTSPWAKVALRTVSSRAHTPHPTPQHQLHLAAALVDGDRDTDEDSPGSGARTPVSGGPLTPRAGLFSSVGRTLSSGVVGAASGVAGAPRRVSDFAGGLYRPRAAAARTPTDEQAPLVEESVEEAQEGEEGARADAVDDDDVE